MGEKLIRRQGDHRNLLCYRKAEVIYDITYHFAHSAFRAGDRTIDQMVQAARSGKQNIVEGNADLETSTELGIRLIGVAKASFQELLSDYEDFLRVNNFEQWAEGSDKCEAMRQLGKSKEWSHIVEVAKSRPLETVANMAIILIKQEDYLLVQLQESLSENFVQAGGFKERMFRQRANHRRDKKE